MARTSAAMPLAQMNEAEIGPALSKAPAALQAWAYCTLSVNAQTVFPNASQSTSYIGNSQQGDFDGWQSEFPCL
jgi:hypothetical protein